ncbi:EAL domain-containing protein [Vibrio sp. McD22-P3]|uniref:EAL domain-containing protein n=1 Tax=Vibrio sp. McD22-P3 TaxID=2724880 RepID=UPI001F41A334|nr:EAL domain-containing protein [Vibrio sp. McD22-P3]MCF4176742.1 EAL domain-containing protein [Vibrio sp. McD22-P3]
MKKTVWNTLLPLLAVFCTLLAISLYFEKQRANSYKLDALIYEVTLNTENNLNQITNSLKQTLLAQFKPCSPASLLKLNDLVFENEHIRWASILSNGQIKCETNRRNWLLEEPFSPKKHYITSQDYLTSATRNNDTDTFIGVELGAYDVIVDIDLMDSIIDSCTDCAQFTVKLNTVPPFTIASDAKVKSQEREEVKVDVNSDLIESLVVITKPRFFNTLKLDNKLTITAILIALLLTIVLYVLYSKNVFLSVKIRFGIKNNEFVPYYQPIIDTHTNSILGSEVLMRWETNTGKIIKPQNFIQHSEKTGLILSQTYSMLDKVFKDIKKYKWDETALIFSINITPDFLIEDSFYYQLLSLCTYYDIAPNKFAVEMTERQDILDSKQIHQALSKLKTIGVSVKLDDIGVGYSSLLYLVDYPIDTIKLDKSFIDEITDNPRKNLAIISTLIELANRLQMDVVAEGVETKNQVEYLRERGVRLIQGYYFSKPVSNNLFNALLSKKFNQ